MELIKLAFLDKRGLLSGKVFELGTGTYHKHRSRMKLNVAKILDIATFIYAVSRLVLGG